MTSGDTLERRSVGRRPPKVRGRVLLTSILLGSAALGGLYVALVPPGLPYDEPAHWGNAVFYLDQQRMPVLGEPSATYEAQHGPVAYLLYALAAWPFRYLGDGAAFYAARAVLFTAHIVLVCLTWTLIRRLVPASVGAAAVGAAAVGWNPMLLAMAASVQNDTLFIVFGLAGLLVVADANRGLRRCLAAGLLMGLALLTKLTAWPFVLAGGVWLVLRRQIPGAAVYGGAVIAVAGWWVLRNVRLYGTLTAHKAVEELYYDFQPVGWDLVGAVRGGVTYMWLPTEYFRNQLRAPTLVDILIVGATALGAFGVITLLRRTGQDARGLLLAVAAAGAAALMAWLVVRATVWGVPFRFAYGMLPVWFAGVGALALRARWQGVLVALGAMLMSLNVWVLVQVARVPPQPFDILF